MSVYLWSLASFVIGVGIYFWIDYRIQRLQEEGAETRHRLKQLEGELDTLRRSVGTILAKEIGK
jgi:hypothetical protein